MIWAIGIASLLVPMILAFICVRSGLGAFNWGLAAVLALVLIWAFYKSETTPGWDAFLYAIIAYVGAMPALLGAALGSGLGAWANHHTRKRNAKTLDPGAADD